MGTAFSRVRPAELTYASNRCCLKGRKGDVDAVLKAAREHFDQLTKADRSRDYSFRVTNVGEDWTRPTALNNFFRAKALGEDLVVHVIISQSKSEAYAEFVSVIEDACNSRALIRGSDMQCEVRRHFANSTFGNFCRDENMCFCAAGQERTKKHAKEALAVTSETSAAELKKA